jgi:hypothetical protein
MRSVTSLGALGICLLLASGCSQPGARNVEALMQEYELSRSARIAALPTTDLPPEARPPRTDAPRDRITWLAMGGQLAQASEEPPAEQKTPDREFTPWRRRRGPAYPGDFWRSFGRDAKEMPATIWDDTIATFTNKWALVGLTAAVASGVALDAANTNGCVADHYRKNRSQLNTFWDNVGDVGGNPGLHFAVAGAMYFTTLYREDVKNYEVAKALLNALAINGLATVAMKGIAHSDSPNDDPFGWPSGHTSSTFCFATVMHEAYGPWVGVPLFAFASFVGYERIDARNHDFNDVISGALIGIAIGHAVYQNHQPKIFGMDVIPWVDPEKGTVGIAMGKQW